MILLLVSDKLSEISRAAHKKDSDDNNKDNSRKKPFIGQKN